MFCCQHFPLSQLVFSRLGAIAAGRASLLLAFSWQSASRLRRLASWLAKVTGAIISLPLFTVFSVPGFSVSRFACCSATEELPF